MSRASRCDAARLTAALALLPDEQREVFMAVAGGESYADIAKRSGISVGEVEHRFASALARLDEALDAIEPQGWWHRLLGLFVPLG